MIKKIFDLENLQVESEVEGITDWKPTGLDINEEIKKSRGEFVGYYSEPRMLKLFRDRIGARNLYYSINGSRVYISTDILWVVEYVTPELDIGYIKREYLPFQIPFSSNTIYQDIKKVMPGEVLTIPVYASGPWERGDSHTYWHLEFSDNKFIPDDLLCLIDNAVQWRKNLIGDNFTSYLSGGLDSSSITMLSKPRECFSGFYEQEEYSELDYITSVLKMMSDSTKGFKVKITEKRFHDLLEKLPFIMPDPIGGLGVIPQVIVAMVAKNHGYKYSMTGEGGDEIFYGYPWNTLLIQTARAIRNLSRDKFMIRWEPILNKFLSSSLFPGMVALIEREHGSSMDRLWSWDSSECVENNIMRFMIEKGLPAILTVDECVGKYTGVIPVSPLVDHHIIEYVASISPEERTKIPKYLLREAMKDILPNKVLNRYEKMGFPVPINQWKWPALKSLIESFWLRDSELDVLPLHRTYNVNVMDRQNWGVVNLELIGRMLDKMKGE